MSETYADFLSRKAGKVLNDGFPPTGITNVLFPFQRYIVEFAIRKGRSAIFADTGLGKTLMQIEWAMHVNWKTDRPVLILCPLAVADQTRREADKIANAQIHISRDGQIRSPITISNYEQFHKFDLSSISGIVLDESSILKNFTGKTRTALIDRCRTVPYRLCCTATPAPNDYTELGNHAEFLGWMTRQEMLSKYFVHDASNTKDWRLKGHAVDSFWSWVKSWAILAAKPSDLGAFDDDGFVLPGHEYVREVVPVVHDGSNGELFAYEKLSSTSLHREMRRSASARASRIAEIHKGAQNEPLVIWCNTNYESDAIRRAIPSATEVRGSDTMEHKEQKLSGFTRGEFSTLITKPKIAGFGLNWQHCNRMVFTGLSYSYEALYQAIRRCYRFGQERTVYSHLVYTENEAGVMASLSDKEAAHESFKMEVVSA